VGLDVREVKRKGEPWEGGGQKRAICAPQCEHTEEKVSDDADDGNRNSAEGSVGTVIDDTAIQRSLMLQGERGVGTVVFAQGERRNYHAAQR
jgi:hypothetical protein